MPRLQVVPEQLLSASGRVGASGADVAGAQAPVLASGDALAWTPAAGAYDALLGSLGPALASSARASDELSAALAQAAVAYQISDATAAARYVDRGG